MFSVCLCSLPNHPSSPHVSSEGPFWSEAPRACEGSRLFGRLAETWASGAFSVEPILGDRGLLYACSACDPWACSSAGEGGLEPSLLRRPTGVAVRALAGFFWALLWERCPEQQSNHCQTRTVGDLWGTDPASANWSWLWTSDLRGWFPWLPLSPLRALVGQDRP